MAVSTNQLLVLRYLSECSTPVAGIDISADLSWVATSSIYAAISALQAKGQVEAEWDHSQSHPRRLISINQAGTQTFREAQALEARPLVDNHRMQEVQE